MWKKILPFVLPLLALGGCAYILWSKFPNEKTVERPSITVVDSVVATAEPKLDAGVESTADAGIKVRPTAQELSERFLTWELRDLIEQAPTPEDRRLVQDALYLRLQRAKALELSPDFETNMRRGVK